MRLVLILIFMAGFSHAAGADVTRKELCAAMAQTAAQTILLRESGATLDQTTLTLLAGYEGKDKAFGEAAPSIIAWAYEVQGQSPSDIAAAFQAACVAG